MTTQAEKDLLSAERWKYVGTYVGEYNPNPKIETPEENRRAYIAQYRKWKAALTPEDLLHHAETIERMEQRIVYWETRDKQELKQ
jgi:choline dehydrogenase-like flavoprotein